MEKLAFHFIFMCLYICYLWYEEICNETHKSGIMNFTFESTLSQYFVLWPLSNYYNKQRERKSSILIFFISCNLLTERMTQSTNTGTANGLLLVLCLQACTEISSTISTLTYKWASTVNTHTHTETSIHIEINEQSNNTMLGYWVLEKRATIGIDYDFNCLLSVKWTFWHLHLSSLFSSSLTVNKGNRANTRYGGEKEENERKINYNDKNTICFALLCLNGKKSCDRWIQVESPRTEKLLIPSTFIQINVRLA